MILNFHLQRSRLWVCNDTKHILYSTLFRIRRTVITHHRMHTRDYRRHCGCPLAHNGVEISTENLATIFLSQWNCTRFITRVVCWLNLWLKATAYIRVCLCTLQVRLFHRMYVWKHFKLPSQVSMHATLKVWKTTNEHHSWAFVRENRNLFVGCDWKIVRKDSKLAILAPGRGRP